MKVKVIKSECDSLPVGKILRANPAAWGYEIYDTEDATFPWSAGEDLEIRFAFINPTVLEIIK